MEKPRFASFVDLFLEIQITVTRATSMLPTVRLSIFNFGMLLFCTNQHELSFVIIKFELIRKHIHTNVRYIAFYGKDRIGLISSRAKTKRQQVKLSVISIGRASDKWYLITSKSLLE